MLKWQVQGQEMYNPQL